LPFLSGSCQFNTGTLTIPAEAELFAGLSSSFELCYKNRGSEDGATCSHVLCMTKTSATTFTMSILNGAPLAGAGGYAQFTELVTYVMPRAFSLAWSTRFV